MISRSSLRHRLLRGGGHLGVSLLIASLVAVVVFGLWYPDPYRTLSGGLHLFLVLVAVDATLGPLATFVVSKPGKSLREWRMDVALIAFVQLLALGYGLWSMYQARPVYMAFELDRMRIVHAVDVVEDRLSMAPEGLQKLPQWGPGLIAVRDFRNADESVEATMAALQGVELGFRPDFWQPYSAASSSLKDSAKPVAELLRRYPARAEEIEKALSDGGLTVETARYLPLHARSAFWTVLLREDDGQPVAYLPLDPYEP